MGKEHFIKGKVDNGKHDGLYANRKRLDAAIYEQLLASALVYRNRDKLHPQMVEYHENILRECGLLDK